MHLHVVRDKEEVQFIWLPKESNLESSRSSIDVESGEIMVTLTTQGMNIADISAVCLLLYFGRKTLTFDVTKTKFTTPN